MKSVYIRWKISIACTGALKSDVNMYLLCKNSSILNNSTTQILHMHRPSSLIPASASSVAAVLEMVQQGCGGFVNFDSLHNNYRSRDTRCIAGGAVDIYQMHTSILGCFGSPSHLMFLCVFNLVNHSDFPCAHKIMW